MGHQTPQTSHLYFQLPWLKFCTWACTLQWYRLEGTALLNAPGGPDGQWAKHVPTVRPGIEAMRLCEQEHSQQIKGSDSSSLVDMC